MKVFGMLESAQLEQTSGTPGGSQPTGRIVADVTSPSAAVPYFYNGTAWKQLAFQASTSGIVSQNSGSSCTVDWSTGLVQQVILTDNTVISFSNPQSGQRHKLLITQNSEDPGGANSGGGTTFCYQLNMIDQDSVGTPYQPQNVIPFRRTRTHEWEYKLNVKPGYATVPYVTWSFGSANASYGGGFSPDGKHYVCGKASSPFTQYHRLSDVSTGTMNPINVINYPVSPTAAAALVLGVKYHPEQGVLVSATNTSPYIQMWVLNQNSPGSAHTNPGTLPTGAAQCVDIHPTGYYAIVGHTTTPFMSCYPIVANTSGFGTKLTNPATLPAAQVNGIAFSKQGDYLCAVSATSPYIQVWRFFDFYGTGTISTASANPAVLPTNGVAGATGGRQVAWRPQGDYIAMCMNSAPFIYIVPFNRATGTFGTAVSCAASGILAQARGLDWSPDGQYLIVGTGTAGQTLFVFDFSAFTITGSVAIDAGAPAVQINDVTVHPSGEYFIANFDASPWSRSYGLPQKQRNYVKVY